MSIRGIQFFTTPLVNIRNIFLIIVASIYKNLSNLSQILQQVTTVCCCGDRDLTVVQL
jgi:hypothetical protein